MEIGPVASVRPITGAADLARPGPDSSAAAVGTDLPAEAAVAQPYGSLGTGERDDRAARRQTATGERHLTIDAATHAVVTQRIDAATQAVLSQVPDEGLLKLKAYAREVVAELDRSSGRRVERIA